jgi:hypothetical protein
MAVRLRVKEVAKEKGISMGKLQRDADVAYNTVKRMFKDPYGLLGPPMKFTTLSSKNACRSTAWYHA